MKLDSVNHILRFVSIYVISMSLNINHTWSVVHKGEVQHRRFVLLILKTFLI